MVNWFNNPETSTTENSVVVRQRKVAETREREVINIRQAQGWVVTNDGTVVLTANAPKVTNQGVIINHPSCQVRE